MNHHQGEDKTIIRRKKIPPKLHLCGLRNLHRDDFEEKRPKSNKNEKLCEAYVVLFSLGIFFLSLASLKIN